MTFFRVAIAGGVLLLLLGVALTCSAQVANPTHLTAVANGANHTVATTPSITPSSNALLIAWIAWRATADRSISSVTTTLSNVGAWTILSGTWEATGGSEVGIAYATITGSPGSGTVTWNFSSTANRSYGSVEEIASGYSTTTPVRQTATPVTGTGLTQTISLASSLLANSKSFSCISDRAAITILNGSGETELHEGNSTGSSATFGQSQYSTDQTHDWSTLGASSNSALLIEVQPPSAAAPARRKWLIK